MPRHRASEHEYNFTAEVSDREILGFFFGQPQMFGQTLCFHRVYLTGSIIASMGFSLI